MSLEIKISKLVFFSLIIFALITALSISSVCRAQETGTTGMEDMLSDFLSKPAGVLIIVIQFGLGFGLGYFSMRVLKYIIALIAILVLGVLLNIWQFGGLKGFVDKTGLHPPKVYSILKTAAGTLGVLTIFPVSVGFFIGIIIAMMRK